MDISTAGGFQQAAIAQALEGERNAPQGVVEGGNSNLGMDDFFKLLTTQLTSQDPLQPMEDKEFISQMAQFSSLSQMENMATDMQEMRVRQESMAVQSLMGRQVRAEISGGEFVEGEVTRVARDGQELVAFVGEQKVPYKSIVEISDPPGDGEAATEENAPSPDEQRGLLRRFFMSKN